jgi:hypothetical protein
MGVRCCFAGDLSVCPKKPQPTSAHRLFIIRRRPTRSPSQQTMSSRPSRPARCQHKSSGSCSSCEPVRCQHRSSTSCSLCQRERNDLQQVGAWARESRNTTSIDNASFLRDSKLSSHRHSQHSHQLFLTSRTDPEALRTTTTRTKTPAQPHSQSKQSTQPVQSTQHHQQPATTTTQKLYSYKHHPSISPPSIILSPRQSQIATPSSSSIAATCPVSPINLRTVPIYNVRQTLPATTNAAVVARGILRISTPQITSRLGARSAGNQGVAVAGDEEEDESEEDSEDESEDDDDEDDDE